MYTQYLQAYAHHSSTYGDHTAIFYLVGKFYEMYDWIHKDTGAPGTSMSKVVDILGIQMSIKKDDSPENTDGFFAGVPEQSLHKYAGILTRAGWTVVIYDQTKDLKGAVKSRDVSRILTPGTHVEALTRDAPYVAGIWLEDAPWGSKDPPSFALVCVDLSTGRIFTYEGVARGKTGSWSADDAIHFFQVYSPRECTIWWRGDGIACPSKDSLSRHFGLLCQIQIYPGTKDVMGGFEIPFTREEFLRRSIQCESLLPLRDFLGITNYEKSERALCATLQRLEELFPSGIQKFYPPTRWSPNSSLFLGNNALLQLNMITSANEDSVLGLFQKTQTSFGLRAIRNRLLHPHSCPVILKRQYEEIAVFESDTISTKVEHLLKAMGDLPRLHRRLVGGGIAPEHIMAIDQTYTCAKAVAELLNDTPLAYKSAIDIETIQASFQELFSIERALKACDTSFCFQTGKAPRVDILEAELIALFAKLNSIVSKVTAWASILPNGLRIEYKETMSPVIIGPKASIVAVQKAIHGGGAPFSKIELVSKKSSPHIEIPELGTGWADIMKRKWQLQEAVKAALIPLCDELASKNLGAWDALENWLSLVDVTYTIWKRSKELGFVMPTLLEGDEARLSISCLRHPLIERQVTRTEYVTHTVELGTHVRANGWLVYGMNASGKSSLMKAVGIAVLLAQAGCYVPATQFIFVPFKSLFTRILNTDNLWAGLSSFAVEMTELREILLRADTNSLVLGDELCSGTESISATALVGAGLKHLHKRCVKFIFATHFHGLMMIPAITQLEQLKVWHLKVRYDHLEDILVYERTLTPGSGSSLYGLEVARAMCISETVLADAMDIRKTLLGTSSVVDAPISAWNPSVQRKTCELCSKSIVNDLEVHHVQQRANAVNGRNSDGTHINDLRNLIVVCSNCHDSIHSDSIQVGSVVQTSVGPRRTTTKRPVLIKPLAGGYNQQECETIENYLRNNPSATPKRAVFDLEQKGITISFASLKGFRKNV
jgi:DNA mismatch repair protein MutS